MAPTFSNIGIAKFANNVLRRRLTMVHELSEIYQPSIKKQKDELIELIKEKAEMARKSELARKIKVLKGFYTLEIAPPLGEKTKLLKDLKVLQDFIVTPGTIAEMSVKEVWLVVIITIEIIMWFFIGESIAKGRVVGYVIPESKITAEGKCN